MTFLLFSSVLLFVIVSVSMVMHIRVKNFECSYAVTLYGLCQATGDRFKVLHGHSVQDCVIECALRQHRNINLCQLFLTDDGDKIRAGHCVYVKRSDIQNIKVPPECLNCQYGERCDRLSTSCEIAECINQTTPENGQVLGNLTDICSTVRYKCSTGYKERKGITSATCLKNGIMSHTAEYVRDCGEPRIDNAKISNGVNTEGSIRKVKCLNDTTIDFTTKISHIQCAHNGSWLPEGITCSTFNYVVFRVIPGIGHGSVEAWTTGTGSNSNVTCRNALAKGCTSHYRDPRIDNWESHNVKKTRYSVFKDGNEVSWLMINGKGSNSTNWFNQSRLISTSYSGLTTSSMTNYFAIESGFWKRNFYVSVSHNGCYDDNLYLVTIDTWWIERCWYDDQTTFPQIFYSKVDAMANTNTENEWWRKERQVKVFVKGSNLLHTMTNTAFLHSNI